MQIRKPNTTVGHHRKGTFITQHDGHHDVDWKSLTQHDAHHRRRMTTTDTFGRGNSNFPSIIDYASGHNRLYPLLPSAFSSLFPIAPTDRVASGATAAAPPPSARPHSAPSHRQPNPVQRRHQTPLGRLRRRDPRPGQQQTRLARNHRHRRESLRRLRRRLAYDAALPTTLPRQSPHNVVCTRLPSSLFEFKLVGCIQDQLLCPREAAP
ncbi:hypothetical protein Fmac_020697 [Flemingia macrophylla]|uniref:Uncharacterized protein n=1 Tax=Flemingia macrophylla TaxID=520843 RepID=A0ABD1LUR2_9FABA